MNAEQLIRELYEALHSKCVHCRNGKKLYLNVFHTNTGNGYRDVCFNTEHRELLKQAEAYLMDGK